MSKSPAKGIAPRKDLVLTESYGYETEDFQYAREANELGYELFTYDPNPGVVPLMVPYTKEIRESINGIMFKKPINLLRGYWIPIGLVGKGLLDI